MSLPLVTLGMLGGSGSSTTGLLISSVTSFETYLIVQFNSTVTLGPSALDPANWSVSTTGSGMVEVSVTGVSQPAGNQARLEVSKQTDGETYTLNAPDAGVFNDGGPLLPPFSVEFTGAAPSASILLVRPIDARTIDVYFSVPVIEADALNPANYSISGLEITAASKVTETRYRITTSRQTENQAYNLSVTIRDLAYNPIL